MEQKLTQRIVAAIVVGLGLMLWDAWRELGRRDS